MLEASFEKITLNFKRPAGTSRGILTSKDSWIVKIWHSSSPAIKGIGEASIIKTLSPEWNDQFENKISAICQNIHHFANHLDELTPFPSIKFAIESALIDLKNGGKQLYFQSAFTDKNAPIKINGLIWMGDPDFMKSQIREKLNQGFSCIKMKIGALDFETEIEIIKAIRSDASSDLLELRVDANGAFTVEDSFKKLEELSKYNIHSIEQPIRQGQTEAMADLCKNTTIPIALDEELIGIYGIENQDELLSLIKPQYIILKPSLIGGLKASDQWINLAQNLKIDWWITSALESNIGLNIIAQYTFTKNNPLPQGLGTGSLFTNNIPSNLTIRKENLFLNT